NLGDEARSREQLDSAVAAEKTALSALEDAKSRLKTAKTAPKLIASAKATSENTAALIKQAEADLAQAEKDLADTKVIAGQSGKITKKNFEKGDYIQAATQIGYIVGNEFWVTANFKETQLKNMRIGDKAEAIIDAFPSLKLTGKIASIQSGTGARFSAFPPENATGNFVKIVQRVPVKILLDIQPDNSLPLGAGISVYAKVYTR
ncbi:MAG: efflux RND transporter periplasmic adaptor subunit, partial [Pseudomonadota bacterium]